MSVNALTYMIFRGSNLTPIKPFHNPSYPLISLLTSTYPYLLLYTPTIFYIPVLTSSYPLYMIYYTTMHLESVIHEFGHILIPIKYLNIISTRQIFRFKKLAKIIFRLKFIKQDQKVRGEIGYSHDLDSPFRFKTVYSDLKV